MREELWAKKSGLGETYPLFAHMLDSAAIGKFLFEKWLRPELQVHIDEEIGSDISNAVAWLIGIHDLGKANPLFQYQPGQPEHEWGKVRAAIEKTGAYGAVSAEKFEKWKLRHDLRRHEKVSALSLGGLDLVDQYLDEAWKAIPSLAHHGYFSVPFSKDSDVGSQARVAKEMLDIPGWTESRDEISGALADAIGIDVERLPETCSPSVSILISGLTVLADRLASNLKWVERTQNEMRMGVISLEDSSAWFKHQHKHADEYVKSELGIYQGWEDSEAAANNILKGREPRAAQEVTRDSGGGLQALMAPTGSGKTEAALLRHSKENERLIFLLPTQATSNALMRRIQSAFSSTSNAAALAHGMASLEDFYATPMSAFNDSQSDEEPSTNEKGGLYPASFVRSGMARMLAPVCVATVDQALKAGLKIKWVHLLLTSLANAHIVIDEVHTLDHYQTRLLVPVLRWLGRIGARVTLLTATLPSWQYARLFEAYTGEKPNHTATFPALSSTRQQIELEFGEKIVDFDYTVIQSNEPVEHHVEWVERMHKEAPMARLGVLCNRVAWAQDVAENLREKGFSPIVLHSAMTAQHRKENAEELERLLGPGSTAEGVIVVGTQVIEASLDIDLDALSTDLCPSASLIQRGGRVWRRDDDRRETRVPSLNRSLVHVVSGVEENEHYRYPYLAAELIRTGRWIAEKEQLVIPGDCQEFVDVSTVTFAELNAPNATDAEFDQFAAAGLKLRQAENVSYDMDKLLNPDTPLLYANQMFGGPEQSQMPDSDDLKTRLIEEESVQVIIGAPSGSIPGAWSRGLEELKSLESFDLENIRTALKGSMPMRLSKFEKIRDRAHSLDGAAAVISKYFYVDGTDIYDTFIGLALPTSNGDEV